MPYTEIEREGRFRVKPMKLALRETTKDDSKSLNVSVLAQILEQWNPDTKQWESWESYAPYEVKGNINLVKKDGTINERSASDAVKCLGWNGDIVQFNDETWVPNNFQCDVKAESYNGKQQFRMNWLYPFDSDPTRGSVDPNRLGELVTQYGGNFRAIASNLATNGAKPAGAPKPPPAKAAPPPAPSPVGEHPF